MTTPEEIVKALALVSREPTWTDDYGDTWCTLCSGKDAAQAGVVSHDPSCPWQMAVEWCPRQRAGEERGAGEPSCPWQAAKP